MKDLFDNTYLSKGPARNVSLWCTPNKIGFDKDLVSFYRAHVDDIILTIPWRKNNVYYQEEEKWTM